MTARLVLAANALQALHRTISGVTAPDVAQYPNSLNTPDLPFLMSWPGAGSVYTKGGGYATDERTFEVYGYVQAAAQDDLPSRAEAAMTVLSDLTDLYADARNIRLLDPDNPASEGYQMTIETNAAVYQIPDTGVMAPLKFGSVDYIGFRVSVRVRMLWVP